MTYDQECREFVRILTTTPLSNGQSLRQATDYEEICFWWMADFDLINLLLGIPEDQPVEFDPTELRFQDKLCRLPLWCFALLNVGFDLIRKSLLCVIRFFFEKRLNHIQPHCKKVILFNSEDLFWRTHRDYTTGQSEKTDIFFHSILNQAKKENLHFVGTYPFIKYMYPLSEFSKACRILVDRYKNGAIPFRSYNHEWNFKIASIEYQAGAEYRKRWKSIENDPVFKRLCHFKGVDRYEQIRKKIRFYFYILFPYMVKRLALSRKLLKRINPSLVLLINEYGHFERNLLIAAKEKNIPVMAIQHGNITASHQGYIYHPDDISKSRQVTSPYCPIPDKTALFGEHFKKLLSEVSAYPPDSLTVTGNPGYDILKVIQEKCSRREILHRYHIDATRKVVLWTTQSHGLTDEENNRNLGAISRAAKLLPECIFVIKQHPNESEKYFRLYNQLAQTDNIVLVDRMANILELIFACDIVLVKWSTTVMEAMALEKDIIILNLGGDPDRGDYVGQGIAAGVYESENLASVVRKIINKTIDLSEKRRQYIHDYLFQIDGQATERIVDEIKKIGRFN